VKTKRLRAIIIGLAACALLVASVGLVSARVSGRIHVQPDNSPMPWNISSPFMHGVGLIQNPEWNALWESNPDNNPPGGFWPAGSDNSYLYLSTYWVGIMKNGIVTVMATQEGYTSYVIWNEWSPEGPFTNTLWNSDMQGWPPIPGEPTLSEQDTLTQVVDDNPKSQWGGGERIGLRLKRHNMSWSVPDHDDWITYWFTLTNLDSFANLEGLYFSCAWDIDVIAYGASYMSNLVGYEGNDATDEYTNPSVPGNIWDASSIADGIPDEYDSVNFRPISPFQDKPDFTFPNYWPRNTAYMYSEESSPGYIFCRLFGYKLPGETQTENQLLVTSQHSWDIFNDPTNDAFMYGYQSDTGVYQEIASTPFDWRICPTVGPFDLAANQSVDFYVGLMVTDAQGSATSLLEGRRNLDQLVYDWLTDFKIASPPHSPLLSASHTMSGEDPTITLRWTPRWAPGKNAETDIDTTGSMAADFDGYMIWRSTVGFDTGWEVQIMYDKNTNGQPLAYHPWGIHGGIENNSDGSPRLPVGVTADRVVDFGQIYAESSYNYVWEDINVVGGKSYYYSVVCYDFGWNAPDVEDRLDPVRGGYSFNALTIKPLPFKQATADNVLVVPNPYRGSASWERWNTSGVREQKIMFMNLPSPCTIRIFTASGDLVKTLKYNDTNYGAAEWNLATDAGLLVTSGVYFYHVDSPVGKKIGKFALLMGSSD
jgi:hypothetical protein